MNEQDDYCTKRVFSGERWDMKGHRCGHKKMKGSEFCFRHQPVEDASAPATAEPQVSSRAQRTFFASLSWEPGTGPVVRIPYQNGHGFITHVTAKQVDDQKPELRMVGVNRKKDGSVGANRWEERENVLELLTEDQRVKLFEALEASQR